MLQWRGEYILTRMRAEPGFSPPDRCFNGGVSIYSPGCRQALHDSPHPEKLQWRGEYILTRMRMRRRRVGLGLARFNGGVSIYSPGSPSAAHDALP